MTTNITPYPARSSAVRVFHILSPARDLRLTQNRRRTVMTLVSNKYVDASGRGVRDHFQCVYIEVVSHQDLYFSRGMIKRKLLLLLCGQMVMDTGRNVIADDIISAQRCPRDHFQCVYIEVVSRQKTPLSPEEW